MARQLDLRAIDDVRAVYPDLLADVPNEQVGRSMRYAWAALRRSIMDLGHALALTGPGQIVARIVRWNPPPT